MNEFLKNLRSNQSQYKNGNRKSYDSHYHPNRERRSDYNRRSESRRQSERDQEKVFGILKEFAPVFVELLPKFAETFERFTASREKLIEAEERKSRALENITQSLSKILSEESSLLKREIPARDPVNSAVPEVKFEKEVVHKSAEQNRKSVVEVIKKMRAQNHTYDHIAQYLTEHKYPTFSHRGEWHAQTVHRLFKRK